jgi:exodeoxyribonuclease V gamma subunit
MWQFHLWRELRARLGMSPGEVVVDLLKNKSLPESPIAQRMAFFGIDSVSPMKAALINLLGERFEIPIFALSPSIDVFKSAPAIPAELIPERSQTNCLLSVESPILKAWGRPLGESAGLLKGITSEVQVIGQIRSGSLLNSLQNSLSRSNSSSMTPSDYVKSDGSIQIHKCYGAVRQVEVLRDALLHILDTHSDIYARDILVLCPQLERFESIIRPIFEKDIAGQNLRVSVLGGISDASSAGDELATFLTLCAGRSTASETLTFLNLPSVKLKLEFSDEDIENIERWVSEIGVSWGIDARARHALGFADQFQQGTWSFAYERLLTGILIPDDGRSLVFDSAVPYDDLGSQDFESVGRFLCFLEFVRSISEQIREPISHGVWATIIDRVISTVIDSSTPHRSKQVAALWEFTQTLRSVEVATNDQLINTNDVLAILNRSTSEVRGGSSDWRDCIRFGTLDSLKGVDARVIAILGLDHGSLRKGVLDGDDILEIAPRVGDRDPRLEDRASLLFAISCASDYLIITCDGFDLATNTKVEPSITLDELVEEISKVAGSHSQSVLTKPLVFQHSRLLADNSNFSAPDDAVGAGATHVSAIWNRAWSFDSTALQVLVNRSTTANGDEIDPHDVVIKLDPIRESDPLSIDDLARSIQDPFSILQREALGIKFREEETAFSDLIEIWPSPLMEWNLGEDLLRLVRDGGDLANWEKRAAALGQIPPGAIGARLFQELSNVVSGVVSKLEGLSVARSAIDIGAFLGSKQVVGLVEVFGEEVVHATVSKWSRSMRTKPWLEIAALTLVDPNIQWEARVVGRGSDYSRKDTRESVATERFRIAGADGPSRRANAQQVLEFAAKMHDLAAQTFVPLFKNYSWILTDHAATSVNGALNHDLNRSDLVKLLPVVTPEYVQCEESTEFEMEFPEADFRAKQYAILLMEKWQQTVQVLQTDDAVLNRKKSS